MYVWYATYGSNLLRERFITYLKGGKYRLGGKSNNKCEDSTMPVADEPYVIPHKLYFANKSPWWENKGVAFISPKCDKKFCTHGRIWKITEQQFDHVWCQEGKSWYCEKLVLGNHQDGTEIVTITNCEELPRNPPSNNYLRTIIAGLKEMGLTDERICDYLIDKDGISGKFTKQNICEICRSSCF